MSQHHKRMTGTARQKRNRKVFAEKGDVCYICGHPGADSIDHVLPLAPVKDDPVELERRDTDLSNLRPAHFKPCPTCDAECNRNKGTRDFAPIIRRSSSLQRP